MNLSRYIATSVPLYYGLHPGTYLIGSQTGCPRDDLGNPVVLFLGVLPSQQWLSAIYGTCWPKFSTSLTVKVSWPLEPTAIAWDRGGIEPRLVTCSMFALAIRGKY